MDKRADATAIAKLPVAELTEELAARLKPVAAELPDERLRRELAQAVRGIVGAQSPVVTEVARGVEREQEHVWPAAKRSYRFLANGRFGHRQLLRGLVRIARRAVAAANPASLVVALDPVRFEQPSTKKLEAVSTVMRSAPPGPDGEKRLTPGSPAVTAAVVCSAHWFSYRAKDFRREHRELWQAIRATRVVFPRRRRRFVGDSGLDEQKLFAQLRQAQAEFVIRVSQLNRLVEVHHERLDRWESASLADSTDWRSRPQIEHTDRVEQEDGLDVEDMRVRTLERMRRLFLRVLLAADAQRAAVQARPADWPRRPLSLAGRHPRCLRHRRHARFCRPPSLPQRRRLVVGNHQRIFLDGFPTRAYHKSSGCACRPPSTPFPPPMPTRPSPTRVDALLGSGETMLALSRSVAGDRVFRAVLAGFLCTILASIVLLVAYAASTALAPVFGGTFGQWLLALTRNPATVLVQGAVPRAMLVNLTIGVLWAVVYAVVAEPRLPGAGWQRGALFALLPWALSLLVFLPLIGAGFLGLSIGAGPLPIIGNLIVHLTYGVTLGALYALETEERAAAAQTGDSETLLTNISAERGMALGLVVCGIAGALLSVIGAAIAGGSSTAVWTAALAGGAFGAAAGALVGSFLGLSHQATSEVPSHQPR